MSYSIRQRVTNRAARATTGMQTEPAGNEPSAIARTDSPQKVQQAQETARKDIAHDPDFAPDPRTDDLDEGELARLEGGDKP